MPNTPKRKTPNRTPKPATPAQRLLTGQQVEMEYGVPYRTLYDWYLAGKLPAVRLDRRLRFQRTDVDRLISANSITAPAAFVGSR